MILASLSGNLNQETRSKLRASCSLVQLDVMLRASRPLVQFRPREVLPKIRYECSGAIFLSESPVLCNALLQTCYEIDPDMAWCALPDGARNCKCFSFPFSQHTPVFLTNELLQFTWLRFILHAVRPGVLSDLLVLCPSRPFIGNHRKSLFHHGHLSYQQTAE